MILARSQVPHAWLTAWAYTVALQHGRRFVGAELKPSYWVTACRNLEQAKAQLSLLA